MNPTIAIVIALIGSGPLGVVVAKYFRPNATQAEQLEEVRKDRIEDKEQHRLDMVEVRAEIAACREEAALARTQARMAVEYIHVLRPLVPPPPPPWPEGLNA